MPATSKYPNESTKEFIKRVGTSKAKPPKPGTTKNPFKSLPAAIGKAK